MTPARQRDVRYLRVDVPRDGVVAAHVHATHQLLRVERGALALAHGGAAWVVPTGGGVWLPAQAVHRLDVLDDASVSVLYIRPRDADRLPPPGPVGISSLLHELMGRLSRPVPDAARRSRLEQVVRDELAELRPMSFIIPLPLDGPASQLARGVFADPADDRPLDELADGCASSTRTLQRRFRTETGLTFQAWRRRVRLQQAMTVMSGGGTVTQAAHRCGFASASAFITAFHAELGVTPGAWSRARVAGSPPLGREIGSAS